MLADTNFIMMVSFCLIILPIVNTKIKIIINSKTFNSKELVDYYWTAE